MDTVFIRSKLSTAYFSFTKNPIRTLYHALLPQTQKTPQKHPFVTNPLWNCYTTVRYVKLIKLSKIYALQKSHPTPSKNRNQARKARNLRPCHPTGNPEAHFHYYTIHKIKTPPKIALHHQPATQLSNNAYPSTLSNPFTPMLPTGSITHYPHFSPKLKKTYFGPNLINSETWTM